MDCEIPTLRLLIRVGLCDLRVTIGKGCLTNKRKWIKRRLGHVGSLSLSLSTIAYSISRCLNKRALLMCHKNSSPVTTP